MPAPGPRASGASVAARPVKLTLIGPDRISQRFAYEDSRDVYADMDEFLADVVEIERQMIYEVLKRNQWNKTKAAAELKISQRLGSECQRRLRSRTR